MKTIIVILSIIALTSFALAQNPQVADLLSQVGIPPTAAQRGLMDNIGFASTPQQMDSVFARCQNMSAEKNHSLAAQFGWDSQTAFTAALCPHDDYYYAGRLYALALSRIKAPRVVIFGVAHKAKVFDAQNRLIFDSYPAWFGPYSPVKVSSLRENLLRRLPQQDYVINNDMQTVEHSVEAFVNFLQAYNRDVEIVSILVPYMDWENLSRLSNDLTLALYQICKENKWTLGKNLAFVCSEDAVHYGDSGWGGTNYAPYGCDLTGYSKMVEDELQLIQSSLAGPISPEKIRAFFYTCVDQNNPREYRRTWCGRFSIPFGLDTISRLTQKLESHPLTGYFLDYGASVSEASLDVENLSPLGPTAPNNFHHWVGYAALGYR